MTNRDPLYGESNTIGSWETSDDSSSFDATADLDRMNNKAQEELDDYSGNEGQATDKAKGKMGDGKEKAGEMAGKAQQGMDDGMNKAAGSMDSAAQMLREKGGESGTMGSVAGTAADAMESAGTYLRDTNTGEMMDQVEAYIRQNPTQSLLIAAGVGFVLAKAFK